MSKLSYLTEAAWLLLLLVFGVKAIDHYFMYEKAQVEFDLKSKLQSSEVQLSIETLSAINDTTHHYDQYAQKQLRFENLYQEVKNLNAQNQKLESALFGLLESVTDYMQYATMLKTSFRFVSSMELDNSGLSDKEISELNYLFTLVATFRGQSNIKVEESIKGYLPSLESTLQTLENQDFKWSMFKLHLSFILEKNIKASELLMNIKNSNVNNVISENLIELNKRMENITISISVYTVLCFCLLYTSPSPRDS